MPATTPADQSGQHFVLGATPSVRSLIAAAVVTVLGAVLLVLAAEQGWPVVVFVVGVLLMVLGLALAAGALLAYRRFAQTLLVAPEAITVVTGRRRRTLRWHDVDTVQLSGRSMVLRTKNGSGEQPLTVNPGGYSEDVFADLVQAVRAQLDADRGYQNQI